MDCASIMIVIFSSLGLVFALITIAGMIRDIQALTMKLELYKKDTESALREVKSSLPISGDCVSSYAFDSLKARVACLESSVHQKKEEA